MKKFQRLHFRSSWVVLHGSFAAFGIWCLIRQIWNGFSSGSTIIGAVAFAIGFAVCLCCLETICIDERQIQLKLGPIVLRRIPISAIRTLVRTYVTVGKGGSCGESIIILSPHSQKELRKLTNKKPDAYYGTRLILGILPGSDGLWLCYSKERMDQLLALLPNATEYSRD